MKKRMLAVLSTAALALGGALAIPAMASAHTGDLHVTAVCNTETYQYDLTATLTTANSGLDATTMWRIGTSQFQGTPNSNAGMDQGPILTHGAQTVTLGTFSLPGDTTGYGPWVYAFTKWANNYTVGSDGQLTKRLTGDCTPPPIPEKPLPIAGDEQQVSDPVCVLPLDGAQVSTVENRIWTQDWVWNADDWAWELDKRVYGEWEVVDTVITDNEKCEPEEKDIPIVIPPAPEVVPDAPKPPVKIETAARG